MSVRANRSVASSIEFRLCSKAGFFLGFEGEQAKRRTRNETKNGLIGERTK